MSTVADISAVLAHTGESIQGLNYASLADLKADLVRRADISVEDQYLITNTGMSASKLFVDDVKLQSELPVIYVFNRRHIKNPLKNPVPLLQDISAALPYPEKPSRVQIDDITIAHVMDYRNRYKWDVEVAECIEHRCIARISAANKFLDQMRNQVKSLCALSLSLKRYFDTYDVKALQLAQSLSQQRAVWEELLHKFEENLRRLGSIELHPGFRKVPGKPERTTLLDCVNEGKLREWREKCAQSLSILSGKVEDVTVKRRSVAEVIFKDIPTESSLLDSASVFFLETVVNEWNRHLHLAQEIRGKLETDFQTVSDASTRVQNLMREGNEGAAATERNAIESIWSKHLQIVKELEGIDVDVGSRIGSFNECQSNLSSTFFSSLSRLSKLQSELRESENMVTVCVEAAKKLDDDFGILLSLSKMEDAYKKCIEEICRRKSFDQLFFKSIQSFSQKLNQLRADEMKRRKWFMREYGRFLPQELVDLTGRPPACEIQLRSFDPEWAEFSVPVDERNALNPADDPNELRMENQMLRAQVESLLSKMEKMGMLCSILLL
jgi:hypothetical protein